MRDGTKTKERIKKAALRLFVEQGVAETSIREIAKAAKVSQGAMYNHYTSKDELAWDLFSTHFSEFGLELRRIAPANPDLPTKFRAMIRYVFERFDADWVLVSYVFLARHQFLGRITRRQGNPYSAFHNVIAEAMRRGEIPRQDVEVATSLVVGGIIQMIDTAILAKRYDYPLRRFRKQGLEALSEPVADACVHLLMA